MFEHFAIAFAAHASFAAIETAFKYVARKRPDLVAAASAAQNTEQIERIFKEAVGVIIAEAATGRIIVDGAAISALRGVKFDHQHGQERQAADAGDGAAMAGERDFAAIGREFASDGAQTEQVPDDDGDQNDDQSFERQNRRKHGHRESLR